MSGQFEVLPSLVYSGTAAAFDGRSQIKKDLETVQTAIRTVASGGGVKEYKIGSRSAKKYDLAELFQLEAKLKANEIEKNLAVYQAKSFAEKERVALSSK